MKRKVLSVILEALPFMIYLLVVGQHMTRLADSRFVCILAIMVGLAIIAAKVIETVIIHQKGGKTEDNEFVIKILSFCLNVPVFFMAFKMVEHLSKVPGLTVQLIASSISFSIYHLIMSHISDALVYNKRILPLFLEEDDFDDDDC